MRIHPLFRVLLVLALASLACNVGGSSERLPPTSVPERTETPAPESEGGVDDAGFFNLNLSQTDREGLEQRADEIYQKILNTGGDVDRGVLLDAYRELADYERVGGEWRPAGPAPIQTINMPQGQVPGSGRVNGFAIDPRNSDVVYAAASVGGIWKTEDGGQSWRCLTDDQVPLIYGGIVMDPSDPDALYALLGEFDGQLSSSYGFLANGIMRTRDSGETWELVGAEAFNAASVTALVFDGDGAMYAASGQTAVYEAPPDQSDFGVFKSTDGGDSWERLLACGEYCQINQELFETTAILGGVMDLDISVDGTLYASLCNAECIGVHLLRSTDGGESWEELDFTNVIQDWEAWNEVSVILRDSDRLPYLGDEEIYFLDGLEMAVSTTDPNVLLAGGGLYFDLDGERLPWSYAMRSTDGGDTWEWLSEAGDYCSGGGGSPQCTYDNFVEIDPTDSNVMYLGGSFSAQNDAPYYWFGVVRRSSDGGDSWEDMTPPEDGSLMHPDAHGMAFDPNDPNVIWVGGDGGIYRTPDASADPPQWENLSEGLNTLLFIGIGLHPTDPDYIVGGMQDNANAFTTDGGQTWVGASQGDGGDSAVDPFEPSIVYSFQYNYAMSRNENGGDGDGTDWFGADWAGYSEGLDGNDNWLFYPPFLLDPNNEGVMYVGSSYVYRSDDRGDSWYPISDYLVASDYGVIQTLALSNTDPDTLYVGTTDGLVWVTRDGGGEWWDVTGPDFPPRGVNRIAVDPTDPDVAYAAFGGFVVQTPDNPGHVFRTTDGGESWEDITFNLPDAPLSAAVVDARPDYAGVYVGGALGVWVLQEGSAEWLPYGTGMPFSLVKDLELNPETGIMAAATYGRSVWIMDMP